MRLAFWRAGNGSPSSRKAVKAPPAPEPAAVQPVPVHANDAGVPREAPQLGDLDLRALGRALARKRLWIILPTLLVAVAAMAAVNVITPRYKSEARILIDGRENIFLRPN